MTPVSPQLRETLLVAYLDNQHDIVELPTGNLAKAFPGWSPESIPEDVELRVAPRDRGPLLSLVGEQESEVTILYGPASVGVRMEGESYQSWGSFRDRAVEMLERAVQCYHERNVIGMHLIYVDAFQDEPREKHTQSILNVFNHGGSMKMDSANVSMNQDEVLASHKSRLSERHRLSVLDEKEVRLLSIFLVETFDGEHVLPSERLDWLNAAHERQKWMLWNRLAESYRQDHLEVYFDVDEIRQYANGG